ncbi:hypothetical protein FA95DRAFT_1637343 [Auriscalpium vulgare]|uniref:Uncharacterized protein n=1 Tax=Auriscalpium vulgare TaxID=40419 RepID=A0ACB8RE94_9AGAM|nr:hypothetical protein FA95DRAFT_1637343 [Auriscalpium vulgare]
MATIAITETCWHCDNNTPGLQRCTRCRLALYCNAACQKAAWKTHKSACTANAISSTPPSASVKAVRLKGGFNRPFFPEQLDVPPDHPIWGDATSVSPVSQLVGVPIKIWREAHELPLDHENDANRDNQSVTYLMIRPEVGFATARWLKNIGPVIIARADQKPLSIVALEMIWMFCDMILDRFGENRRAPWDMYNRAAFEEFCENYKENFIENGMRVDEFKAQELPL